MRNITSALSTTLACFLVASISHAQVAIPNPPEPFPGEQDVGAAISPMRKSQGAPFTGVLLSPKAVATIVAELNSISARVKIEVDKTRGEEQARCEFKTSELRTTLEADKKILSAQLDERNQRINVLMRQVKEDESRRVDTPLWMGVSAGAGFVVGIAATVFTVYAVNQASK